LNTMDSVAGISESDLNGQILGLCEPACITSPGPFDIAGSSHFAGFGDPLVGSILDFPLYSTICFGMCIIFGEGRVEGF